MKYIALIASIFILSGCVSSKQTKTPLYDNSGQVAIERKTTIPQAPVMVGDKIVTPKPITSVTKYFRTQDVESFKMDLKQHKNGTVDLTVDEKGIKATDAIAETTKIVEAVTKAITDNRE